MPPQGPLGPFCQSCSMPLDKSEDFGSSVSGYRVNDYCRHCYQDGVFTDPECTLEQMIDRCVAIMANRGIMPEGNARALLSDVMPRLKRWREPAGVTPGVGGRGMTAGETEC